MSNSTTKTISVYGWEVRVGDIIGGQTVEEVYFDGGDDRTVVVLPSSTIRFRQNDRVEVSA